MTDLKFPYMTKELALFRLDAQKEQYLKTDNHKVYELMCSLAICTANDIPLPEWLSKALLGHSMRWLDSDEGSLDDAFDFKPPTDGQRARWQKEVGVISHFMQYWLPVIRESGGAIPWDDIAEFYGVSRSKFEKLYYDYKLNEK